MTGEQKDRVFELAHRALAWRVEFASGVDKASGNEELVLNDRRADDALHDAAFVITPGDVDALHHWLFGPEREVVG